MSLFRTPPKSAGAERASVLIELKLIDKLGLPIDPSAAWLALLDAFKGHPHFSVKSVKVIPDKESPDAETP